METETTGRAMFKLPHDIIVDVLSYLPAKPLTRFKCVCKSWCSLISDPHFVKLHLKRAKEESHLSRNRLLLGTVPPYSVGLEAAATGDDDAENAVQRLHYPDAVSTRVAVEFLGSCDGLVCIADASGCMVIWNPSIRESRELPNPSPSFLRYDFFSGLGYDPSADDYKMVIGGSISYNGSQETIIEVLALKSNTWRRTGDTNYGAIRIGYHRGIFWNGALHWLGTQGNGPAIVSFDIAKEQFEAVCLPAHFRFMELGISGNSLFIFNQQPGSSYEAWITSKYDIKQPITKAFVIPYDRLELSYVASPVCLTNKGELLLEYNGSPACLEWYKPEENTRKFLVLENGGDPFFESVTYIESLVSLR